MNWFIEALKKYAVFTGRSRRKEYWFFVLFYLLIAIVLGTVDGVTGLGVLSPLGTLALLVPSIAVAIRRLHDVGKSGWWLLLGFVPLVGLVLLYFMVQDSQPGGNEYGPNPKAAEA